MVIFNYFMKPKNRLAGKKIFSNGAHSSDRFIRTYPEMTAFVKHCKGLGLGIVLTQGTYDMVHIGHARYLETAKSHGDILIVGIDSDKKVRARKGPERPVVPEGERLEMVTHLRPVDVVFLKKHSDRKWSLIKAVRPDVLIATKETYTKKHLKDLKKYCGKIVVLERQATTTTSAKLRLMQLKTAKKFEQALTPRLMSAIQEVLGSN